MIDNQVFLLQAQIDGVMYSVMRCLVAKEQDKLFSVLVHMNVVPRSTMNTNGSLVPFTRANAQWVIHGFK